MDKFKILPLPLVNRLTVADHMLSLMKSALFLLAILPLTTVGQQPHRQKADSIVAFFLGDKIFRQYIQLDEKKSQVHSGSGKSSFFQYTFRHPKFSGKTHVITFMLDSTGQFIANDEMRGLIQIDSPDSNWIAGPQALKICKDESYRIKKRSLRLSWSAINVSYDLFQKTHNFRDIGPGHLVWEVDGEVEFRGDRYSGKFQVDVFTGTVARVFAIPWD